MNEEREREVRELQASLAAMTEEIAAFKSKLAERDSEVEKASVTWEFQIRQTSTERGITVT